MHNYDFKNLNDKEFESMVVDLLSHEFGSRIERFKPGKDQGVDGRFFLPDKGEGIIQCKHYLKSGFKALLWKLKNEELDKVKKLKPKRYIVATSLELSRHEKSQIKNALAPYIITAADVYGAEDLNVLLGKHSEVENNHYKLWLASTTVLQTIMNYAIIGRSGHLINEAQEESCKYVMTANHELALKKIKETHAVILTGEPGIGKTTLANSLCLYYAAKGFSVIYIEDSIGDAEAVYNEDKQQVFYYDDFLGRNYLTALNNKVDSHIVQFIKRVQKDKTKRFILTSRTNILNQGKRLSDVFKASNIERTELEVKLENINRKDKARILYNHIFFSNLSDEFIEEIYKDKRYLSIINHRNYNPRLIEFITDQNKVMEMCPSKYWDYITETLNNPVDIWEKAFEVQIDTQGRDIVSLVVMNGTAINEDHLQTAFYSMSELNRGVQTGTISTDYASSVRSLTRALLNRNFVQEKNEEIIKFDLFNPSIGDYVVRRIAGNKHCLAKLFYSLETVQSLHNLQNLYRSECISVESFRYILKELSGKIVQDENVYNDYNFLLGSLLIENKEIIGDEVLSRALLGYLRDLDFDGIVLQDVVFFLKVVLYSLELDIRKTWHFEVGEYIVENIYSFGGHDQFIDLCYIVDLLSSDNKEHVLEVVKKAIIEDWEDCVYNYVVEDGVISDVYDESEILSAEKKVFQLVGDCFIEYLIHFSDEDIAKICENVPLEDIINDNIDRASREMYEEDSYQGSRDFPNPSDYQFIDDLFDRDS
jgi:tRNA uridine 5-carbamoylmethylation protein Kti12